MAPVQQYLISARFVTTMGHLIALLLLFSTVENNINVSLGDNYSSSTRDAAVNTAWVRLQIRFTFPLIRHLITSYLIFTVSSYNRIPLLCLWLCGNVLWNVTLLQFGTFSAKNFFDVTLYVVKFNFVIYIQWMYDTGEHVSDIAAFYWRNPSFLGGNGQLEL